MAKFKALFGQFNCPAYLYSLPMHDAGDTPDLVLARDEWSVLSFFTGHSVKSNHIGAALFTITCASFLMLLKIYHRKWKWKSLDVICATYVADAFEDFSYQDINSVAQN